MTSQNLWSPYDRQLLKIYHVIQIKLNQLVEENVYVIINLPTKRI